MENESTKDGYSRIEIDMADWDKELLYHLIQQSCERDVSVNVLISDMLEKFISETQDTPE
jgi:hypothetical protein